MERGAVAAGEEGGVVEGGRGEGGESERGGLRWRTAGAAKALWQAERPRRGAARRSSSSSSVGSSRSCSYAQLRLSVSLRRTTRRSTRERSVRSTDERARRSVALVGSATAVGTARSPLHAAGNLSAGPSRVSVGVLRGRDGDGGGDVDDVLSVGRGGVDSGVLLLVRVGEVGSGYRCR